MNENTPVQPGQPDEWTVDAYMMGRSDAGTRRLIRQSQLYAPFTRRFFDEAGIGAGMRVLDVGTGAGDVALMAAEVVGPKGSVVGVDQNPEVLQTARSRALAAGRTNTTFLEGEVPSDVPEDDFDAVVGRLVLLYLPNPAEALRVLARRVHSGGIVAFQEFNQTPRAVGVYPPMPLWEQTVGWLLEVVRRADAEAEMGYKLRRTYLDAGLPEPRMRLEAPVGGGPDWGGYEYVAETLRSVLPLVLKFGIATAEEVDIDTLAERLRTETVASGGVVKPPELVSAWARKR